MERDGDRERSRVFENYRAVAVPVEFNSKVMSDRLNDVPAPDSVAVRNRTALATVPSPVLRRVVFIQPQLIIGVQSEKESSFTLIVF